MSGARRQSSPIAPQRGEAAETRGSSDATDGRPVAPSLLLSLFVFPRSEGAPKLYFTYIFATKTENKNDQHHK